MLKLWDADSGRETRSMGGHTGTITSVFLVPKEKTSESGMAFSNSSATLPKEWQRGWR